MLSSSIDTVSVAVAALAGKVTLVGAVPEIMLPLSVTDTVTVRDSEVAPVRLSRNFASASSRTAPSTAAIVTTFGASSSRTVTLTAGPAVTEP